MNWIKRFSASGDDFGADSALPADFPASAGTARNAYILAAIDSGAVVPRWVPIQAQANGHTATFMVLGDALKIGGVRINTSARVLQQIADKLGACLMTPRLLDLAFLQASIVIPPCPIWPNDDTSATMVSESAKMDKYVAGQDNPASLLSPIGKNWVIANCLTTAKKGHAALYGWAVAPQFQQLFGDQAGVPLHKGTMAGILNIQPLATPHDMDYTDYAMLTSLVSRQCTVDGRAMDIRDVMTNADLAPLLSHEGVLKVTRQPGVPELPAVAASAVSGDTMGHEARYRVLFAGDDFGTIAGQHTVSELKDLIAAKDFQVTKTEKLANDPVIVAKWASANGGAAYQQWYKDWLTFRARYNAAMKPAVAKVIAATSLAAGGGLLADAIPAEAEYQGLFRAVRQSGVDGQNTPGDLDDLMTRLGRLPTSADAAPIEFPDAQGNYAVNRSELQAAAARQGIHVDDSGIPQPTAADLDLMARNKALGMLPKIPPEIGDPNKLWKEIKPYAIAGGALAGLALLSSIIGNLKR